MKPPDLRNCGEEELWRYVAWHLETAGIHTVLVGGSVVSIYTEGLYRSGDIDMVPDTFDRSRLAEQLEKLGFKAEKSRCFKHPECPHLFLDFPPGPVELGEQFPVIPDEIVVEGRTLRLLSPTDCVKDRLAAYIHWGARAGFNQALLVCRRQKTRVDIDEVALWCRNEGAPAAFDELSQALAAPPSAP